MEEGSSSVSFTKEIMESGVLILQPFDVISLSIQESKNLMKFGDLQDKKSHFLIKSNQITVINTM